MRLIVNNTTTKLVVGGKDNLMSVDLFDELYQYLSIKIPGANHAKRQRAQQGKPIYGGWDGMRHMMTKKGVFATGFVPMVIKEALEMGAYIDEIVDERNNMTYLQPADKRGWEFNNGLIARDYQQDAVNRLDNWVDYGYGRKLYFPRGIGDLATNAGKNSVISCTIKNMVNAKALVVCGSQEIFDQLYEVLAADYRVGRINSKYFEWGEDVTLAMVKTLDNKLKKSVNVAKELQNRFNVLLVDECHEASSATYTSVVSACDAGVRYFVSGTPLMHDNPINDMVVVGLSGLVIKKVSKKFLMDTGVSLKVKVFVHLNPSFTSGLESYDRELETVIWKSPTRCDIIGDIIDERPCKKILISFRSKEHGQFMFDYLTRVYKFDKMAIVHGTDKERKQKIGDFKSGKIEILLSSDIFKQGINIKDINVLIYARGEKAKTAISQWSGRVERDDGISEDVEYHEFWDESKVLSKHSRSRIKFLKDEGFEINYLYEHKRGTPI